MTISIKVTNTDSRPGAIVAVRTVTDNAPDGVIDVREPVRLAGGEETTGMVHSGQMLLVEEVQNG